MILAISLLVYLPKVLFGFLAAHLLWRDYDFKSLLIKLAVGIPFGFSLSASAFFLTTLLGLQPKTYSWGELIITAMLVTILMPKVINTIKHSMEIKKISKNESIGIVILLTGYGLFVTAFIFYSRIHAYGFEDAWSMWNFVARFIYRSNSPEVLLNSSFYDRFHPDYPVGLNLNVAWGWFIMRKEITQIPASIALLSASASPFIVWATLWKWKNIFAGAVSALFIILTINLPMVVGQYADALLISHMVSAIALFYCYIKTEQRDNGLLILAGLLAGFSAWIKNEGIVFMGVFIGVCLLASWKHVIKQSAIKWLVIGLLPPIGVVLVYKLIVSSQSDLFGYGNSFLLQVLDPTRWKIIGASLINYFLNFGNWPVSVVIILALYAVFARWDQEELKNQLWLFLIPSGQLAGYFFIYLITPHDLWLHIHTSMDRLVAHLFPMFIFWVLVAFSPPKVDIRTNSDTQ